MASSQQQSQQPPQQRLPLPQGRAKLHADVLADGLYSQDKVKPLEAYLQAQVSEGSYDFEANKTLLKLYLLYPNLANQEKVEAILLKALLNLPATDFTLLLYILPEKLQTDERLLTIKDAAEAVETARYSNLWAVLNSRGPVFDAIPNWRSEIRKIILSVLAATYAAVDTAHVAESLGLSGSELSQFLAGETALVSQADSNTVTFAPNPENQPRVRKQAKKAADASLSGMLNMLGRMAA